MADLQRTVGVVIRRERERRGLTLRELAERSIVSPVYLGEIERGQKYPSALVVEHVAEALDITAPDFLDLVVDGLRATEARVTEREQEAAAPIGAQGREGAPRAMALAGPSVQASCAPHEMGLLMEIDAFLRERRGASVLGDDERVAMLCMAAG